VTDEEHYLPDLLVIESIFPSRHARGVDAILDEGDPVLHAVCHAVSAALGCETLHPAKASPAASSATLRANVL
jgi:hypothetical protein